MKSISGLGLGLSVVFGCLLLALIAELYYLLWWKKRIINKIDENGAPQASPHFFFFFFIFCCCFKNHSSLSTQQLCSSPNPVHEPHNPNKDFLMKQELNNFPRFLFTITEETGEDDLESEDGGAFRNKKNSTSRSNLSDLVQILETPFSTPNASPPYFTPPLTPSFSSDHVSPFSESEKDAEFNRLRCSPPPKFKFLRDAEEKLIIQTRFKNQDDHFITLNIVDDNQPNECFSSNSSQVFHSFNAPNLQHQICKPHLKFNVC